MCLKSRLVGLQILVYHCLFIWGESLEIHGRVLSKFWFTTVCLVGGFFFLYFLMERKHNIWDSTVQAKNVTIYRKKSPKSSLVDSHIHDFDALLSILKFTSVRTMHGKSML